MVNFGFSPSTKWKTAFFLSILITFTAQLNIDLFNSNFKISIAIICFPLFLILLDEFPVFPVTFLSAIGVYLSRVLLFWLRNGFFLEVLDTFLPELFFYLWYGCLLCVYCYFFKNKLCKTNLLIPIFLLDYTANLLELLLRFQFDAFELRTQIGIVLVALFRTLSFFIIISILERYRLTLLHKEHADRYERLMILISKLNGEVIWMQKNTTLIEDTMNTSYQLSQSLHALHIPPSLSSSALKVARDVHEIKKEYYLIMRGLSETLQTEFEETGMYVQSILALIQKTAEAEALARQFGLVFHIDCRNDLHSTKHYALLSIFHNLITNAMEAFSAPSGLIHITQTEERQDYLFQVTDNGPGIKEEDQAHVFDTGFSTKINYTTGTVSRGLGLNIVKNIIEQQLSGHITLSSQPGETIFSIYIPKIQLEVKPL